MKKLLTTIMLTLGLALFAIVAFSGQTETSDLATPQHPETGAQATRACPDCSGVAHTITGVTFENGMNCTCTGTVSLAIGAGTTVKSGATVAFRGPAVSVKSGAVFESGASISIAIQATTPPSSGTATASPSTIPADGSTYSLVTATFTGSDGQPATQGTPVTFTTNLGKFGNGTNTQTESLNSVGQAAVALRSTTPGTATVTATSNGVSAQTTVTIGQSSSGLSLSVSKTSVKSDNSDSSTITATVLDTSNAGVSGVVVTFSSNGGQISAASATTDANGQAGITFSSGTTNPANQTVTITAKSGSDTKTIPVQIVGSTVTLSTDKTTISTDASGAAILTIAAKNAGGTGIYNTNITLGLTGTGGATIGLPATLDNTSIAFFNSNPDTITRSDGGSFDADGFKSGDTIVIKGSALNNGAYTLASVAPGTLTLDSAGALQAESAGKAVSIFINYSGNSPSGKTTVAGELRVVVSGTAPPGLVTVTAAGLGATATQDYTVNAVGTEFAILLPASDPFAASTNENVTVRVRALEQAKVIFSTTIGVWDGGTSAVKIMDVPASGLVESVLTSAEAGAATVQVSDKDNTATTDRTTVAFSAPPEDAAKITLQADTYVVAPSSITETYSTDLSAVVKSAAGQVVGSAPVLFSIKNATGGGETVSPVSVLTDSSGTATAKFTSGSLSTGAGGVEITASIQDDTTISSSINIVIGGKAGSVAIGYAKNPVALNSATYKLAMSVLVADGNGNPVSGATVSLSVWPNRYRSGIWFNDDPTWTIDDFVLYSLRPTNNEDINENMILDPEEDINWDGELTPRNSAAGNLPTTITTDEYGICEFNLNYLKSSAEWIEDRVRASTKVLGTEMTTSLKFWLPSEASEAKAGGLSDSPYQVSLVTDKNSPALVTFPRFGDDPTDDSFGTDSPLTAGTSTVAANVYTYTPTDAPAATAGIEVLDTIYASGSTTYSILTKATGEFPLRIVILPEITTDAATNITTTTATSGGSVTADGAVIATRGVCWSTSANPTIDDNKTINGGGAGAFTSNITGLTSGIDYYVRAYATGGPTVYGAQTNFTTD